MSKYLVIVESPAKAKTINAILGKNYEVVSSMGHVVDLPSKKLSIDVEKDFFPHYQVIPGKEKIIRELKKKSKNKEIIYLATDSDREGEAISWHLKEELAGKGKVFQRVVFHEITEDALRQAFALPGDLDMNKVDAQIARRVLDRVVGYYLSPLLWKKIVRGLSAGRVQSIALKFIVEREKEIVNFTPQTTYAVEAKFKLGEIVFVAKLEKYKNKKGVFVSRLQASECVDQIKKEIFSVKDVVRRETKRRPPSPHTTSLLQQDAFKILGFSSRKTMFVAQKLYEGIQVKEAMMGLITYMRTDSFRIAPKAKGEAKEFIQRYFGKDYLPEKEYLFKEKKGAQLAHEAIRPTSVYRQPQNLQDSLTSDEAKLYELIWKRFVASFMKEAIYENIKVILASENANFGVEGRKLIFQGYLKVFKGAQEDKILPDFKKGDQIELVNLEVTEHITKPPPHFNDASLVKLLEEKGIGRPSTYVPTIYTLLRRNYVKREKNAFFPTELGIKVSEFLVEHFSEIINENFTALMEEELDEVEDGKRQWRKILESFHSPFKEKIEQAAKLIKKEVEFTDKTCPKCQGRLVVKWSRRGKFLSCENFPRCRYAESITAGVSCPECKEGELIERRNRRGQNFYGCSKFPECRYTSRELPDISDHKPEKEESTS